MVLSHFISATFDFHRTPLNQVCHANFDGDSSHSCVVTKMGYFRTLFVSVRSCLNVYMQVCAFGIVRGSSAIEAAVCENSESISALLN